MPGMSARPAAGAGWTHSSKSTGMCRRMQTPLALYPFPFTSVGRAPPPRRRGIAQECSDRGAGRILDRACSQSSQGHTRRGLAVLRRPRSELRASSVCRIQKRRRQYPPSKEISDPLQSWVRDPPNISPEESQRRDGIKSTICGGLQIVASRFLRQIPQESAGETELFRGSNN